MATDHISVHVVPRVYAVYLLQLVPKPQSFYVGSSPDPVRRLRQHNGELKAGGAYRTKRDGSRPWKIVCLIYGFPSKVAALQFEHALQHPYQTRHIEPSKRVSKLKKLHNSVHHKLANIRLLVDSSILFKTLNLKIILCDPLVEKIWFQNKFKIPTVHETQSSNMDSFQELQIFFESCERKIFGKAKEYLLTGPKECQYCFKRIDYYSEVPEVPFNSQNELEQFLQLGKLPLVATCSNLECPMMCHLTCMAKAQPVSDLQLLPALENNPVVCELCKEVMHWPDLARIGTLLREYFIKDAIKKPQRK